MAATAQGRVNAMYSHRAFSDNNSGMRTPLPAIPWRYSVTAVNLKWQRHLVTINDLRNDHPTTRADYGIALRAYSVHST